MIMQYETKFDDKTKRKELRLTISKAGIDQDVNVRFHKDRLLTDKVYIQYEEPLYLKSKLGLKTEDDVIKFFKEYSYTGNVSIKRFDYTNLNLRKIIDFNIDVTKLYGKAYIGLYTFDFNNGYLTMTYRGLYNDGSFKITGKRDLFNVIDKFFDYYDRLSVLDIINRHCNINNNFN